MDISDLIIDYTVNEELLLGMRDRLDDFRSVFDFEMTPILLDKESTSKTMQYLLRNTLKTGTAIYTGSKIS